MANKRVLSVMMPVYNEEPTLETIAGHVLDRPEVAELVAVDDGSTDRSWEILQELAKKDSRVRPFQQAVNGGKGLALRRAIAEIRMPFALVQDADLEYDPADYPVLLEPLVSGRADAIYGVRGFAGQTAFSFWFVVGNKAGTPSPGLRRRALRTGARQGLPPRAAAGAGDAPPSQAGEVGGRWPMNSRTSSAGSGCRPAPGRPSRT